MSSRLSGEERDDLEVRRVDALERIVAQLERGGREQRERAQRAERDERHAGAVAVGSLPQAPMFAGERGQRLLMHLPWGYAGLWTLKVPAEHLSAVCDAQTRREWPLVRCACGGSITLERFSPRQCECGRWFLALERDVFVKRFSPRYAFA